MILHALKFPSQPVGGFLMGNENTVTEIVPVYHNYPLTPLLEIAALALESSPTESLIGFYFADEDDFRQEMNIIPAYIRNIDMSLRGEIKNPLLVRIISSLLSDPSQHSLAVFQAQKEISCGIMDNMAEIHKRIAKLVKQRGQYSFLHDIEETLEDGRLGFHSTELNSLLRA